jgi:hypothetical protein
MHKSLFAAAAIGGLIAGTIDIGAAALINQVDPVVVMHAIARGLIGKAAMTGGAATAVLGLVLQWLMSILIALIYALAALKLPVLVRRWPLMGLAYGSACSSSWNSWSCRCRRWARSRISRPCPSP